MGSQMSVNLGPELEQTVRALLESGAYRDTDEVFAAALQALEAQERIRRNIRDEINAAYLQALDPKTEWLDADQVMDELEAEINEFEKDQESR